jgi:hypothetical protein
MADLEENSKGSVSEIITFSSKSGFFWKTKSKFNFKSDLKGFPKSISS